MRARLGAALGAAGLLGAGALGLVLGTSGPRLELHGTLLDPAMPVPDFELTSAQGTVRRSDFRGRLVVLVFGYTTCPDVCPMTLARIARALELVGPSSSDVQVLAITVDPERDSPHKMAAYAAAFDPSFVGLSGTPAEIAEVAAGYGIFHARAEGSPATGYLVDHTATVMVLDRDGRARLLWAFQTDHEAMAADLRILLESS